MTTPDQLVQALDEPGLEAWLLERRWFASKARDLQGVSVLDVLTLRAEDPPLLIALVEAKFHAGTHELYQLVLTLGPSPAGEAPDGDETPVRVPRNLVAALTITAVATLAFGLLPGFSGYGAVTGLAGAFAR